MDRFVPRDDAKRRRGMDGGSLSAMRAWGGSVSFRTKVRTTDTVCGNAKDRLGWARGSGRHGGGALAMCVRPLMSALILRLLLIKEKEQDNRSHRCPSAHELAQA